MVFIEETFHTVKHKDVIDTIQWVLTNVCAPLVNDPMETQNTFTTPESSSLPPCSPLLFLFLHKEPPPWFLSHQRSQT